MSDGADYSIRLTRPEFDAMRAEVERLRTTADAATAALRVRAQEPWLGLASTRQMLDELLVRMEMVQFTDTTLGNKQCAEDVHAMLVAAVNALPPRLLDYRTVPLAAALSEEPPQ